MRCSRARMSAPALRRLVGQTKAERAVGHAELEVRDEFGMHEAARGQVGLRFARREQSLVVVADGLVQQRLVVGIEGDRRGQRLHR